MIALNYGSQNRAGAAAARLLAERARAGSSTRRRSRRRSTDELYTADLPPVDLLIRTSGEQRLSNFLLWQAAYAELLFVDTLWPDFGPAELDSALGDFAAGSAVSAGYELERPRSRIWACGR